MEAAAGFYKNRKRSSVIDFVVGVYFCVFLFSTTCKFYYEDVIWFNTAYGNQKKMLSLAYSFQFLLKAV